jgi:hypothetical protein
MTATIQIYVNIGFGCVIAVKTAYDTWMDLFHVVDLVVDLEMPDVPASIAKKMRFRLTPNMIKCATELYLDNLKQMVVSVFAQVRRKVLGQLDEARVTAEALVLDADITALSELTRSALQDPEQRRKIIREKITAAITNNLLVEMEAIVLPKALKMMSQVDKHTPPPPGIKNKVATKSKRMLVEKKVIPHPGKLLTKMMMKSFKHMLPTFVRAVVAQQYDSPPDLASQSDLNLIAISTEEGKPLGVVTPSLQPPPPAAAGPDNSLFGSLAFCYCDEEQSAEV